jgi:hypothetical protein
MLKAQQPEDEEMLLFASFLLRIPLVYGVACFL